MNKFCGFLSLFLFLLLLLLIVGSWILSAWGYSIKGVLQPEGIRWFFVNLPEVWNTSGTVLLILLFGTIGSIEGSGLWNILLHYLRIGGRADVNVSYRQRLAFRWSIFFWILFLLPYLLLAVTPHSLLLSVTGNLWHRSPFIGSLPYVLLFSWMLQSLLYALLCGKITSLARSMQLLTRGFARFSPLLIVYLEARLLYVVFLYVFIS